MSERSVPEVAVEIYGILHQLDPETRERALAGALAMLGSPTPTMPGVNTAQHDGESEEAPPGGGSGSRFGLKADRWIKRYSLEFEDLERIFFFHADGAVEVLSGAVSGDSNKDRAVNAYLLLGAARLLSEDDPTFQDEEGIELCKAVGCYDSSNHSKYRREVQKRASGGKKKGWTIAATGLKEAAALVKASGGED